MKLLILENIRSAHNVGAIFRTADGAGVDKIFLVGYTPTPIDRFGRPQKEISKTSLGASEEIAWEHHPSAMDVITNLKNEGVEVVSVEQTTKSIPLKEYTPPLNVAYVVGNEVEGVSNEVLEVSDKVIEIPMLGRKESLNVATAAGVVLYHDLV